MRAQQKIHCASHMENGKNIMMERYQKLHEKHHILLFKCQIYKLPKTDDDDDDIGEKLKHLVTENVK